MSAEESQKQLRSKLAGSSCLPFVSEKSGVGKDFGASIFSIHLHCLLCQRHIKSKGWLGMKKQRERERVWEVGWVGTNLFIPFDS